MFTLYINELSAVLSEYKVTVKFFVDDLKLHVGISTEIDFQNFSYALNLQQNLQGEHKKVATLRLLLIFQQCVEIFA